MTSQTASMLLEPFRSPWLGPLKNRVVMSAMTRGFADPEHCATQAMAEYYARRGADGVALILTEGTIVHPTGDGYNSVPHIHTPAQIDSWKLVTAKVRATGSTLFCQLWHCGRISHEDYTGGVPPVSSTSRPVDGINRQNNKPFGRPRALRAAEIPGIHEMFAAAAENALAAGFHGVELHLGHGYLADQFFDARINDRSDHYGGSIENRCRFGLELVEQVLRRVGPNRVMVRISPSQFRDQIYDWPDLDGMLGHLIPAFDALGLRMLDISCARADYPQTSGRIVRMIRPRWPHLIIGGASLSLHQAEQELQQGCLDMVTWGRLILANPDFVRRLQTGAPLAAMDSAMLKTLL